MGGRHFHMCRLLCLLLLPVSLAFAQSGKGKQKYTPEMLCAELFAAVRASPQRATLRLEEALVINESCAGDLVTTALDAAGDDAVLARKIEATALEMAPSQSRAIKEAVRKHKASASAPLEIRRAMVADVVPSPPVVLPGEEVRRAEVPDAMQAVPIVEVRRAVVPTTAEMSEGSEAAEQKAADAYNLMNVPKAKRVR